MKSNTLAPPGREEKSPVYKQILDTLMDRIESGTLAPGDTAPSESDLIAEFRVSSTTARRCLNELAQQGLVTRIQGKGTFVSDGANLVNVSHVGVIYHDLVDLTSSFSAQLIKGINTGLSKANHHPILLPVGQITRGSQPAGSLRAVVQRFGFKGLLLASPIPGGWLGPILNDGVPVTSINFTYEDTRIDHVIGEHVTHIQALVERAADLGHKRITLFRGVFDQTLLDGVKMIPTPTPEVPGVELTVERFNYFEPQIITQKVTRALAEKNPPTLIICWSYEAVLEAAHALSQLGWRVPEDISLCYIGVPSGPSRFTGVSVPIAQIANMASQRLVQQVDTKTPLASISPLPAEFNEGFTLGPISRNSTGWKQTPGRQP